MDADHPDNLVSFACRFTLQALGGNLVAIGFGDTLDQAMQSEATQIVGHASSAEIPGVDAEQVGQMGTQLCMTDPIYLLEPLYPWGFAVGAIQFISDGKSSIAEKMRQLHRNTRLVFDYLRMTKNSTRPQSL